MSQAHLKQVASRGKGAIEAQGPTTRKRNIQARLPTAQTPRDQAFAGSRYLARDHGR